MLSADTSKSADTDTDTNTATQTAGARLARARQLRRQQARMRIHDRVVQPIEEPSAVRDPLVRQDSTVHSTFGAARLLLAAVVVHILVISLFLLVNRVVGDHGARLTERVTFRVVETPPPLEEEAEALEEVVVEEQTPIQSDFTPPKPEIEKPKPKPKRKPEPAESEAPVEPSDAPEPAEPVRRTIGLDFESTVSGGSGPSFVTGTSRMGRTEERAADPQKAEQRPAGSGTGSSTQRAAAHIPTRDVEFVKPKRLRPSKPAYPSTLKAQELEGTVKVSVDLDESGKVVAVRVVESGGQAAFDEAAKKAARSERFRPATRDGKAVPYTLSYSYRFRIDDD